MIGETISHYKILEKLGEGGMGVVYKAEDIKLKRTVAIKFLPPELTRDKEAKERFIHEAQAASALEHANICNIHEIDETKSGKTFIVMACYEGETLKKKIEHGPLKLDEAVDIAIQAAQGLMKVHQLGITHRDIKPANVYVTNDGIVKILDFGLAKLIGQSRLTKEGTTLGTVAYMSTEQTLGTEVDQRTDIWSLGVVLYEMITGQLPFKGDYEQAVVYSIMNEDPVPMTGLRTGVPMELERIVNKCLAKKPAERFQTVSDLLVDLKRLQKEEFISPKEKIVSPLYRKIKKRNYIIWSTVFFLIAIIAAIGIYVLIPFSKKPTQPMKIIPFTSFAGQEVHPAFSPDGKKIAFSWREKLEENSDIYVQLIGTNEPLQLTSHPGNDLYPTWSPDGLYVAFSRYSNLTERGIYIIPALGGAERRIHYSPGGKLSWSPDGKLIAFTNYDSTGSIFVVSLENLELERLTTSSFGVATDDFFVAFSPSGKFLAFLRNLSMNTGDIYTLQMSDMALKRLTFDGKDIKGLTWTSDEQEIIFSSNRGGSQRLWRIPAIGGEPKLLASSEKNAFYPSISLVEQRLAYSESTPILRDIWRIEIRGPNQQSIPSLFLFSTQDDLQSECSPDGRRIAFTSTRSGNFEIWTCDKYGRNMVQLTSLNSFSGTPRWSPNSKHIVFDSRPEGNGDIFIIAADGGSPRRLTMSTSDDIVPNWSKDGHWIYFSSDRTGENQIYKIPSNGGVAIQITKEGGLSAFESSDGKWLYYSNYQDSGIWKIPVEGGEKCLLLDYRLIWRDWTLIGDEILYLRRTSKQNIECRLFNVFTKKEKTIATLDEQLLIAFPHLSPDRKWLLYTQRKAPQSDIILVENFQ